MLRDVTALVSFRLGSGTRSRRRLAVATGLALGTALALPLGLARYAPTDERGQIASISPTVWGLFFVAAVIAAVASAGGRELLPREQAVAMPVSPAADHVGALLLTPLNVFWSLQALVLLGAMGYVASWQPRLGLALLATVVWLVAATCCAQLVGWLTELARTYRGGRLAVRTAVVAAVTVGVWLVASGRSVELLDSAATSFVYRAALGSDLLRWALVIGPLALLGLVAAVAAVPVVEALARRPPPGDTTPETAPQRRAGDPSGALSAAALLDLRATRRLLPVRRGVFLLVAVPLLVVALVELPWVGIIVLPALVASGTALLYGVNAGVLDGRGAVWRESLPGHPDPAFLGRSLVLAGLCSGGSALVVLAAAARTDESATTAELVAVALAVPVATAQVVSRCLSWSLNRPFPAALRSPRDVPAPPVAMTWYSLRLSVSTSLVAIVLAAGGQLGVVEVPVLIALLALFPAGFRWWRALRRHRDPRVRSRLAAAVAGA